MPEFDFLFKIIIIGDSGTGKSSVLLRFVEDYFSESYISTIGVDFRSRIFQKEGSRVKLQIWDTAGQERYRAVTTSYYKGANGIIVLFDKNTRETYDHLERWIDEVKKFASENVFIIIVGNKCDLEPEVSTEEVLDKALKYGVPYIEVSAKESEQINDMFENMVKGIFEKVKEKQG